MQAEELIREYLPQIKVMQLATSVNDQPWGCIIHYYSDDELNIYWISIPERRHSQAIASNPKVSATVLVHENNPSEDYVIGISIEGVAELLGERIDQQIAESYVAKHQKAPGLLADIASAVNPHIFYRLKPSKIVLFDNKHFPEQPRQEWRPNEN